MFFHTHTYSSSLPLTHTFSEKTPINASLIQTLILKLLQIKDEYGRRRIYKPGDGVQYNCGVSV